VERLRTSIMLILLVVGLLLRADALIVLYTKMRSVPMLEGIALSLISPIMAMISFNFRSMELWGRPDQKGNTSKLVLGALGLLFASQIAASWNYIQIIFALDMTVANDRFFGPAADQGSFGPEMVLLMICLYAAILLPLMVMYMGRSRIRSLFIGTKTLTTVAFGAGAILLVQVITAIAFTLVGRGGDPLSSALFRSPQGIGDTALLIIAVAFLAPLIEEIVFRGAIYLAVSERLGRGLGIIISAFLFALVHLDPISFLPLFLLGAILGWCRSRSGSIVPSYILHSANNLAAILWM